MTGQTVVTDTSTSHRLYAQMDYFRVAEPSVTIWQLKQQWCKIATDHLIR
jgi:hypothetical protein